MKKLLLIDGHALIFRTYYAFLRRPMINSKGVDTSITYGFTKTLLELLIKERPSHFAVAFDPPAKTFRHELYSEYKANRSETPEQIKNALEPLCEILEAISVPALMKPGFEADDVIGTFAKRAAKKGFTVYMVTPDKDYAQLLSEGIYQYKPGKSGAESEILGTEEICRHYGIEDPMQVIDILTIWGDASDNIPGVRGVGEVGSKKLIERFKSVENIYKNIELLPEKQRVAFKEAESYIELSKKLVTIDTNVELEWNEESLRLHTPNFEKIKRLFSVYEFSSLSRLLPMLEGMFNISSDLDNGVFEVKKDREELSYQKADFSTVKSSAQLTGFLSFKILDKMIYFGAGENYCYFTIDDKIPTPFIELLSDSSITLCGYDIKALLSYFKTKQIDIKCKLWDTELMHYLIMPERSHKIELLSKSYLDVDLSNNHAQEVPRDLFSSVGDESREDEESAAKELVVLPKINELLQKQMEEEGVWDLYNSIEMPLIDILSNMESIGVKIDTGMLAKYGTQLSGELKGIETKIREIANDPALNISSPKQLGVLLYEKLKLVKNAKKTSKKNYSTDEETLNEFAQSHPIIGDILEYRNIKKLLSTYIDPLPNMISPITGKIHTTYNQSLTATGRLSSVKPNLQNIPIRTERGREIRKAFIPSFENGLIMSADYSQIELRIMAHMSKDEHFIKAFKEGKDIHSATASKIFGVPEDELTREQRNRAKVANFGIIYGISAFGLSQRLNIPRAESKQLIEDYFHNYPGVERYMKDMIESARDRGYVYTLYGRKRYLPDITSKNPVVRGLAERNAINAPIQGSAADIIKVAMIRVYERMKQEGFKSSMVLQVHDELVFDIIPEEREALSTLVKREMEGVIELEVPLVVECEFGSNWLEAH